MLREAGGQAAKVCASVKAKDAVICLPSAKQLVPALSDPEVSVAALAEGCDPWGLPVWTNIRKVRKRKPIIQDLVP